MSEFKLTPEEEAIYRATCPHCPTCGQPILVKPPSESASNRFPPPVRMSPVRVLTEEECAQMDCPFPPEPGYEEEALEKIERRHAAGFKLLAADVAFIASDSTLCLLMNDTFGWACADSEDTKSEDWELLWDLYQKYGYDGLIAWVAVRRGFNPSPVHITDRYREAAAAIRALIPKEPQPTGSVIVSVKSGLWNDPTTWRPMRVPTRHDVIVINDGHTIEHPDVDVGTDHAESEEKPHADQGP